MLVIWCVVSWSLRPVKRARAQVAARQPEDLSPVSTEGVPDEIRPLLQELNLLLERMRGAFALQSNSSAMPRTSCARRWRRCACNRKPCNARAIPSPAAWPSNA